MNFIDQNVSRENIYDKILLLKALVVDLETDMSDQPDLKIQMTNYKSIQVIRQRINNYENKRDRWMPPTATIK
jgi:hypothetical protein